MRPVILKQIRTAILFHVSFLFPLPETCQRQYRYVGSFRSRKAGIPFLIYAENKEEEINLYKA
jgi:hypothetical protein